MSLIRNLGRRDFTPSPGSLTAGCRKPDRGPGSEFARALTDGSDSRFVALLRDVHALDLLRLSRLSGATKSLRKRLEDESFGVT
jgi:hypothetical protein